MKKVTMYELLGMVKDGTAPKKIKNDSVIYIYDEIREDYYDKVNDKYFINMLFNRFKTRFVLVRKVEIIEEDNKDNFTGWKMYQDGKEVCSIGCSTNEEKKIPEKLDEYADVSRDLACEWSFAEKKLKDKINQILDYLEEIE